MAKKFLTQIDMNGLEVRNFLVHKLGTAPTAIEGKLYFNSTDHTLYYYNGTAWVALAEGVAVYPATANPVMDGTAAVGTSAKYAREDHVHPTDTSRAPTSHASSATTYGAGTSSNYGHVKLSDSTSSTSSTSSGTAATPKAVKDAISSIYDSINEAAYSDVDTSISTGSTSTNLPTSAAVATFVSSQVGAVDAMRFKGTLGTGGTITSLPSSNVKVGDTYRVITAGTYASIKCEVGDLVIATATTPTWTVAQTNIDGAVTASTTTTNNYLAKFTGDKIVANGPQLGNGTTTYLRNDGQWGTPVGTQYAQGTGISISNSTINHSNSVTAQSTQALYPVKIDAQGHISAYGTAIGNATTSADGLMSSSDKSKLNSLPYLKTITGTIAAGQTSTTISLPSTMDGVTSDYFLSVTSYLVPTGSGYTTVNYEPVEIDWMVVSSTSNGTSISAEIASAISNKKVEIVVTYYEP